jgi:hypothetical protein
MNIAEVQRWWDATPGWLDTASHGLPPRPAWEAVTAAMAEWWAGTRQIKYWHEDVGRAVERVRPAGRVSRCRASPPTFPVPRSGWPPRGYG